MKTLTICQPYADLICLPDDHDRAKRVENRTWSTNYRGPLLIHAGKSRQWLGSDNYGLSVESMVFGAIIGLAYLRDCVAFGVECRADATRKWPWLIQHEHTEGPWCWILQECRRFDKPIPYRGAQGLFNVPDEVVAEQMASISPTPFNTFYGDLSDGN